MRLRLLVSDAWRSLGANVDRFTGCADFHLYVDAQGLIDQQFLFGADHRAKSRVLGLHLIVADGKRQYLKVSLAVGNGGADDLRSGVGHGNLHSGDYSSLRVVDGSKDSSVCVLSRRYSGY